MIASFTDETDRLPAVGDPWILPELPVAGWPNGFDGLAGPCKRIAQGTVAN